MFRCHWRVQMTGVDAARANVIVQCVRGSWSSMDLSSPNTQTCVLGSLRRVRPDSVRARPISLHTPAVGNWSVYRPTAWLLCNWETQQRKVQPSQLFFSPSTPNSHFAFFARLRGSAWLCGRMNSPCNACCRRATCSEELSPKHRTHVGRVGRSLRLRLS